MRLLTFLILILSFNLEAQVEIPSISSTTSDGIEFVSQTYEFIVDIDAKNSTQKDASSTAVEIKYGRKIHILHQDDKNVYYKYLPFKDETLKTKFNNGKVFSIPKSDFFNFTIPIYSKFKKATVGAYTVPFRLRGVGESNFDFESSLSLQTNLVLGFGGIKKQSADFDASLGIGITSVNLTSSNSLVTEERTASAFTVSIGGVCHITKQANVGLFLGWDVLGNRDKDIDWEYNGKTWLGIGFNISLDSLDGNRPANTKN